MCENSVIISLSIYLEHISLAIIHAIAVEHLITVKTTILLIGVSLSKPHSNVKNGMVVHVKNCDEKRDCNTLLQFDMVVHVQTSTINLQILPYKC